MNPNEKLFQSDKIEKFEISNLDYSLSTKFRISKRLSQVLLILKLNCYRNSSSFLKMRSFLWVIDNKEYIINNLNKGGYLDKFIPKLIPLDNFVPKSILIGIFEHFISISNSGKITLTESGLKYVQKIIELPIFVEEKNFLMKIGKKKLSESNLSKIY